MIIKTATYIKSSPDLKNCPVTEMPEFAFVGRSNVGKSSLINMITNHKGLAKISGKPGKTRMINFFSINEDWMLVDLPGYGYAGVSKSMREEWQAMIKNYLVKRDSLFCTFILVDSRLSPQQIDLEFINYMGEKQLPFVIAFTKSDKISAKTCNSNIQQFLNKLNESWDELPQYFSTSSQEFKGRDEILNFIAKTLKSIR